MESNRNTVEAYFRAYVDILSDELAVFEFNTATGTTFLYTRDYSNKPLPHPPFRVWHLNQDMSSAPREAI